MEEITNKKTKIEHINENLFVSSLLLRTIHVPIKNINGQLFSYLKDTLVELYENKCVQEGYIKPNSVEIKTLSAGKIVQGNMLAFTISFQCAVCFPVEGMRLSCKVTGITKTVIKGTSATENPSPVVIFISLEHHTQLNNEEFKTIKEGDIILVDVIGQRFSLNDSKIEIIASLIN